MKKESEPIGYSLQKFNPITTLLAIINKNNEEDTDFIIAKYIIEHINDLSHISIYTLADECYVSRSSVQRFIKAIGYDSFTALKDISATAKKHANSFITYTDHSGYQNYLADSITDMMKEINHMVSEQRLNKLAQQIQKCNTVVLLCSEDSSSAARLFQQELLTLGKIVRLVTNSSTSLDLLDDLTEDDMVLVCSASGNYAIAANEEVKKIKAYKCVVTMNHTTMFEDTYNYIFYLTGNTDHSSRVNVQIRNVYTQYGMFYFFDLLFHMYFRYYQKESN